MSKADRRRKQRRRQHAQTTRNNLGKSTPEKTTGTDGNDNEQATVRWYQARKIPKIWWPFGLVVGPAIAAALAPTISPDPQVGWTRASGALLAVATFLVLVAVTKLMPVLGKLTTFALVGVVTSFVMGGMAAVVPTCPGYPSGVGCPSDEVVTFGLIGLLTPTLIAILAAGPILMAAAGRSLWRLARRLQS